MGSGELIMPRVPRWIGALRLLVSHAFSIRRYRLPLESMRTRTETRGVLTIVLFHLNIQIIKVSLIIKVYKHNLISPLSLDYLYLIHQISSIFFFDQIDDKTILFVIYTN